MSAAMALSCLRSSSCLATAFTTAETSSRARSAVISCCISSSRLRSLSTSRRRRSSSSTISIHPTSSCPGSANSPSTARPSSDTTMGFRLGFVAVGFVATG